MLPLYSHCDTLGTDRRTDRRVLTDRTDSVDPRPPQQHIILADKGFYPYIVISVARNERENILKIIVNKPATPYLMCYNVVDGKGLCE
jgi:hypothetical protein|tara:strand:+ start:1431 stop:1694 length:264 start_codon:yes stop_codon:yes gene_type:complete